MTPAEQAQKAEALRELHQGPEMLILPNIWDPLGARMLEDLGYPAVATASASVAYSLGYLDGERIGFDRMLESIRRITEAVNVPVTADIERGYSRRLDGLVANIIQVIRAGVAGINLEDSHEEGGPLRPVSEQCERIRAACRAGEANDVPLVINARVDAFASAAAIDGDPLQEAVARGQAYAEAGADCIYPIGAARPEDIKTLVKEIPAAINIYARPGTPDPDELQQLGVRRLTVGPNLLRAAYRVVRSVGQDLKDGKGYRRLLKECLSEDELERFLLS